MNLKIYDESQNMQNFVFQTNYQGENSSKKYAQHVYQELPHSSPQSKGSTGSDFNQKVKKILNIGSGENSHHSLFLTSSPPGFGRRFNSLSPYETTGLDGVQSPNS